GIACWRRSTRSGMPRPLPCPQSWPTWRATRRCCRASVRCGRTTIRNNNAGACGRGLLSCRSNRKACGMFSSDICCASTSPLRPQAATRTESFWARGEAKGEQKEQFHALIALAEFDAGGERWEKHADLAVEQMLKANPLHLGTWVQALRPVRERLAEPLAK